MAYDFPQELLDDILKYLRPDKPSLRSTSLVCRAWRAPSQRGLFFSFTTLLCGNNQRAEMLQPSVCHVLFIRSPHLARYVRNLTLHSPVHSITALTVDILQLISRLPLLKSLSLDAQSPHGITRLVSAILQYLQTNTLIHTVSLGSMCLPPDILYLLPGSPITKLTVSGLREGGIGTGTIAQTPRTPIHLEELHIGLHSTTVKTLAVTLQNLRPWLPHLRTIILYIQTSDVDVLLKILSTPETIPTSVSHFGLMCSGDGWALLTQSAVPRLDLRLTEITDITFGLESEGVGAHWNQWMAKTVNRWANILHDLIPCPLGLRKITLHFWWTEDPDVVDAWLLMDTTLAALHIEEVALSGSLWRDEDVYAAFPELLKKGIIHL